MFCIKCGNQIKDGFKFCPKCGTPVYVAKEQPKRDEGNKEETIKSKKKKEDKSDASLEKNPSATEGTAKGRSTKKSSKEQPSEKTTSKQSIRSESAVKQFIPNSLIARELDIEGVMKKAEQGNKIAMLRQAFRYEMGIGVEKDIVKAMELYDNAGGKRALPLLERSHINCILPNPLYDKALSPTTDDNNNVLKVIPFTLRVIPSVKDVVLDYCYKVELDRSRGKLTKEKSIEYRDEFIQRMKEVRNLYPELLLVNLNETITEEDLNLYFNSIKDSVSSRYSLKWIPSLYNFTDVVDGNKIIIPSLFEINTNGFFNIRYKNDNEMINLLNQFILTLLLQVPIKKIRFVFVDLQSKFYYKDILKQLNPLIYEDKPITSEEKLEELIKRLEDWKLEVMKKYGDYPTYCEQNQEVPIPYEFILFFDNSFVKKYEDRLRDLYLYSNKMGVYFVYFNNSKESIAKVENNEVCYMSEIYLTSNIFYKQLYQNGIVFLTIGDNVNLYKSNEFEDVFYLANKGLDLNLRKAKELFNNSIQGCGNYEVVLKAIRYSDFSCYDIEESRTILDGLANYKEEDKKWIVQKMLSEEGLLLKVFPTEEDCKIYMNNDIIPNISYINKNRMRLIPYFVKKQKVDQIGIALYVPKDILPLYNFEQDLRFYLTKIGFPSAIINQLIDIVSKKINIGVEKYDYFPTPKSKPRCISISEERIQSFRNQYNGFFFPNFLNNKYEMNFGFWGLNVNNNNDLNTAHNAIKMCEKDIQNIEKELDKYAIEKWGKEYAKEHLAFKDIIKNVTYYEVRENKRHRIPILQINQKFSDCLIKPFNITDNDIFSQACFKYINSEAEAKEEAKVISLNYDISNMYEEITIELLINVGKKGKNDVSFRMDLVSHVHSFIIGQSGSGKSVFLHNIIGGAMLKYAPEDLQLYLLDFKLGGVEFNRYKGAKHVKALLVDNSDPQVTLEILRELRGSMAERGKRLRSAGVNNIAEYNKTNVENRMPHVLVVADECHEMFRDDDSIPRQVRNEISDIVIKIAKEGRSQGVHLVFATQTLSGTDISSEIINNVSDFYLLKCAQTDSERLVPNSSAITSELSTGQIYYHHVDEQVRFQAYYTDREAAEKLMSAIVEKAKDHKSNGEFYFNGAQMFHLDETVKDQILAVKGKSPVAFLGKAIDISQKDLYIKLNEDFSENVLLLGLNDQEQVTRTTMNLLMSLMLSAKLKHRDIGFKVIDCLNTEEGEVHEQLFDLEGAGFCEIIERRQRSRFFKELAQGIQNGTAEETILLILGQDRFRELKMDMELEDGSISKSADDDDMMSISDSFFGGGGSSSTSVRTYRDALNVILEKGPDCGVHTLLQLEKASNLLFEDYITPKVVFQKFKHLVMLRSDETTGVTLNLNDEIRLEKLSSDWERLRAYYYAEESDSYTLFTPYMPMETKAMIDLLKS